MTLGCWCLCSQPPFPSHPQGCLQRINRLFSLLESIGLQPSLDSYAAALECMGRNQSSAKAIQG